MFDPLLKFETLHLGVDNIKGYRRILPDMGFGKNMLAADRQLPRTEMARLGKKIVGQDQGSAGRQQDGHDRRHLGQEYDPAAPYGPVGRSIFFESVFAV